MKMMPRWDLQKKSPIFDTIRSDRQLNSIDGLIVGILYFAVNLSEGGNMTKAELIEKMEIALPLLF